jgi:hypothetical protein
MSKGIKSYGDSKKQTAKDAGIVQGGETPARGEGFEKLPEANESGGLFLRGARQAQPRRVDYHHSAENPQEIG